MTLEIWKECLSCKSKICCKSKITCPLFLTQREREREQIKKKIDDDETFNKNPPCKFLNKNGLCEIHSERPIDCKLFPFDILKINKKFFWIIWNINSCKIIHHENFEEVISQFEKKIIPEFKEYLNEYSKFRAEEIKRNYNFQILREVIYS